jgi:hypothetical protein
VEAALHHRQDEADAVGGRGGWGAIGRCSMVPWCIACLVLKQEHRSAAARSLHRIAGALYCVCAGRRQWLAGVCSFVPRADSLHCELFGEGVSLRPVYVQDNSVVVAIQMQR